MRLANGCAPGRRRRLLDSLQSDSGEQISAAAKPVMHPQGAKHSIVKNVRDEGLLETPLEISLSLDLGLCRSIVLSPSAQRDCERIGEVETFEKLKPSQTRGRHITSSSKPPI